jgi:ureidoglycolate hydrolase
MNSVSTIDTERSKSDPKAKVLPLQLATPSTFAAYGQVIMPMEDGLPFGAEDAQLDLRQGTPRFYSMLLHNRGIVFKYITRHRLVTQCLGSMLGTAWMLGVAAPDPASDTPNMSTIAAFLVPGDRFIKLHRGSWHAGPYFSGQSALFYNLELSDTNMVDHHTCNLEETYGLKFEFGKPDME